MEYKTLEKLASIALVRQHIDRIVNGNVVDRKNINPIQKIGRELDAEFVDLLLAVPEIINTMTVVSSTFDVNFLKNGDGQSEVADSVKESELQTDKTPSQTRPKIKTSAKKIK